MNTIKHTPVLLKKAVSELNIKPGNWYVDATFGGGGHTRLMLAQQAKVIAIDVDSYAIDNAPKDLVNNPNLILVHSNFTELNDILANHHLEKVSGILFDLGTSAFQLEGEGRGFSFLRDEPLDMRMNDQLSVSAQDLVNALSIKELTMLIRRFSQEPRAKAIATAIVEARKQKKIETTGELANLIFHQVYKGNRGKLHPATKTFQALRIAVNDELNSLQTALEQSINFVEENGRIVVISFHEGEDRIVKNLFNENDKAGKIIHHTSHGPIQPSSQEVEKNPRSRSAKLRIAQVI